MPRSTETIENTNLIFRNLSGRGSDYNKAGDRNTGVIIPPDRVDEFVEKGYNVRQLPARDPQEEPLYYLKVKCRFDNFPPKIYLCTSKKVEKLDVAANPDIVDQIDTSDISSVDIEISPYDYSTPMRSGRAAYVKTMYVKLIEDPFYEKYQYGDLEDD